MNQRELTKQQLDLKMAWYVALKGSSPCVVCEEDHPRVIELHHKHPEDKIDTVVSLVKGNKPFNEIISETHKCLPLCSNCHRKHHWGAIKLSYLFESGQKDELIVSFNSSVKGDIRLVVHKDIDVLSRTPSIWVAMKRNGSELVL